MTGKEAVMDSESVRNEVLTRLGTAPKGALPDLPELMPLPETEMDRKALADTFIQRLAEHTGVVHRVSGPDTFREKLELVLKEEGISGLAGADDIPFQDITAGIPDISIKFRSDFEDLSAFKDYLFTEAEAGITGAAFAVAESGTLIIAHNADSPRLVSLAPPIHIAAVKIENLVPVYEPAAEAIYKASKPSQITFITGPSMTADIQATPFKGMHGPKRLIVFLIG